MEKREIISRVITEQFEQQVEFLQRLVRARSANPFTSDTSSPDLPVEREVAEVIYQELHRLGFPAELKGVSPHRLNVVSRLQGAGNTDKTLILTTHMDTVAPSDYTRDPWGAQIDQGRLYGLGAADAKAQIAAFIYAARALHEAGIALNGNLLLAFVVDEEPGACSAYGTSYLLQQGILYGDAAIIGEPGNSKIAIGHRGVYRFRLQTYGKAIHTGLKAWEDRTTGRNAILDMTRIALALSEATLPSSSSEAFPGRKSVLTFPTLIQGGSGMNVVPSVCEAYGDVRLLPGLSVDAIKMLIKEQLKTLAIDTYRLDDLLVVPAAETHPQAEVVEALAAAAEMITGVRPRLEGSGPACDGWMFITQGVPTVCGYGVTCGGVHGADEWVDLDSLRTVTEVYAHAILRFLSVSSRTNHA
jgi:acetylornithine deacetylase/succinyl-diaminopimelate desuccinylase-like protein